MTDLTEVDTVLIPTLMTGLNSCSRSPCSAKEIHVGGTLHELLGSGLRPNTPLLSKRIFMVIRSTFDGHLQRLTHLTSQQTYSPVGVQSMHANNAGGVYNKHKWKRERKWSSCMQSGLYIVKVEKPVFFVIVDGDDHACSVCWMVYHVVGETVPSLPYTWSILESRVATDTVCAARALPQ